MKIVLAGATGVIGRPLVPLLTREGHQVVAISRSPEEASSEYVRWARLDVFDRDATARLVEEERPDVVMHQLTDLKEQSFAANARLRTIGTRNLVDAAKSAGVGLMVAQSISWAYEPGEGPATEATLLDVHAVAPRRTTIDGIVALESAVAEMPHYVILRYGTLYGPGTWYAADGCFAEQVRNGAVEANSAISNFLHVADAANAAVSALRWPSGVVNVVDGDPAPSWEWLPRYAKQVEAPPPRIAKDVPASPTRAVTNEYALRLGWFPRQGSWRNGFIR